MQENGNATYLPDTNRPYILDNKAEWLTPMRYIIAPNGRFSALVQAGGCGWESASSRLMGTGEMISGYVNAALEAHFQDLTRILERVNTLLYGENIGDKKPQRPPLYGKLQQQFLNLADLLWDVEAACGRSGIFVSIINRADYLERHLAHYDITCEQICEISQSIENDIRTLCEWRKPGREILVELSNVGRAASEYATGAYMLGRLWQRCLVASPHFSQAFTGGLMDIPLNRQAREKELDLRSDLALLIQSVSQRESQTSKSSTRRNIYAEVDRRKKPDYPRMIVEYKEVTSPELPLIWDLVECLKLDCAPKICPVCGKAFMPRSGERVYCSRQCGTSTNREMVRRKKWAENMAADTVIPEAKRYLNAMRSRVNYKRKDDGLDKDVMKLVLDEYDKWYENYDKEMKIFMNIRASETDKEIIEKAGVEFLNKIRPNRYNPHRRKNG